MRNVTLFSILVLSFFLFVGASAKSLTGSASYMRNGTTDDILQENVALTVIAWIYPDVDHDGAVVSRRDAGIGGNVGYGVRDEVVKGLRLSVFGTTTTLIRLTEANAVTTSAWNATAMTWDGSTNASNVHIYSGLVEQGYDTTTNGSGLQTNPNGTTSIGEIFAGFTPFNGFIGPVLVFDVELPFYLIAQYTFIPEPIINSDIDAAWMNWGPDATESDLTGGHNMTSTSGVTTTNSGPPIMMGMGLPL